MREILRGGDWGDVFTARANGLGLVYVTGNHIVAEIVDRLGQIRDKMTTEMFPEPIIFPRGAMNPQGEVFVCGKGQVSGKFYAYWFGRGFQKIDLESYGTHGHDVIGIDNGFRYVCMFNSTHYYDSAPNQFLPCPVPGTSQGIIQLLPSGPQWFDLLRVSISGMIGPFETPNLFIGEGASDPAHIHALDSNEHKVIYRGIADRPRVAISGDLVGIATRDNRGTFFLIFERPLPNLALPTPEPIPDPEPEPIPEPNTMDPNALALWHQWFAKFNNPGNTDESAREYSIRFAQQLRFSLGPNWGTKRADSGRPISKDTVTFRNGDTLTSYDLMLGVGTGNPKFNDNPPAINTTGQTFVEVQPINHLAVVVPNPEPQPDPNPGTGIVFVKITNVNELAEAIAREMSKFT